MPPFGPHFCCDAFERGFEPFRCGPPGFGPCREFRFGHGGPHRRPHFPSHGYEPQDHGKPHQVCHDHQVVHRPPCADGPIGCEFGLFPRHENQHGPEDEHHHGPHGHGFHRPDEDHHSGPHRRGPSGPHGPHGGHGPHSGSDSEDEHRCGPHRRGPHGPHGPHAGHGPEGKRHCGPHRGGPHGPFGKHHGPHGHHHGTEGWTYEDRRCFGPPPPPFGPGPCGHHDFFGPRCRLGPYERPGSPGRCCGGRKSCERPGRSGPPCMGKRGGSKERRPNNESKNGESQTETVLVQRIVVERAPRCNSV